jgi:8-oxo-dGTP diphosphatase/2-hydroxy-dATP diphosphatase
MARENKKKKLMTLCIAHRHPRVLLGMKKRGFGAGRWNGFGGKLHEGETIEEAARREVLEETGLKAKSLTKRGIITFEFEDDTDTLEVHVFNIESFSGEPAETEEMRPQWFTVDEIPFKEMWSDDPYWFPFFLKGKKFKARFKFDRPSTADYASKILERFIEEVEEI